MAQNSEEQSLLVGLLDPSSQPNQNNTTKKRRYSRCKSAPIAEFTLPKKDGRGILPRSESIFGKFHPSFMKVVIFLSLYLGVGTLCFVLAKNQIKGEKTNGILDAVYFCVVTMTTVGYGDLVPNSTLTKLLACAFVFMGMALVGLILSNAADYLVEKQEVALVKALNMYNNVGEFDILKEIETNKIKYKFLLNLSLLLLLIMAGTIFLTRVENLDIVDAFYCVCSTITTLGYGDKSFSTEMGRIFAVFWILTSTICVAQFFLYLAELYTEHRQNLLVKWVLTRKLTLVDLEAADLDDNGAVGYVLIFFQIEYQNAKTERKNHSFLRHLCELCYPKTLFRHYFL
uniref:Potassium channel domain-containing protein n=1 Tax=Nelumbo nucifera TaxID=4432 RepID=A0A822XFI6_NELNU|nr:TPA_asm: hypothetical protein HUJ06_021707 [Nelumbo nucifera]